MPFLTTNDTLNIIAFFSYLYILYYFISNSIQEKKSKDKIAIFVVIFVFLVSLYLKDLLQS